MSWCRCLLSKIGRSTELERRLKTNQNKQWRGMWERTRSGSRPQGIKAKCLRCVCIFDHLPSLSSLALFFAFVVFFDLLFSVLFVGPQNLTRRTMRWKQKYPRIEHTRRKWFTPICAFESVYPHIHTYASAYTHTHTHAYTGVQAPTSKHAHAVILSFACLLSVCTCVRV